MLSGCDLGGICAYSVLQKLRDSGLRPSMISACCIPSATAMLFAYGYDSAKYRKLAERFLRDSHENDIDFAVANLSCAMRIKKPPDGIPVAVNAVDVATGKILTFTNDFVCRSEKLETAAMGDPYDVLSATISLMDGLGSYQFSGYRLCDYCCWYGCPVYPLKMAGITKIISISFLPKHPKTPYEVLVGQMTERSGRLASLHIPIEFAGRGLSLFEYENIASNVIDRCKLKIFLKTLL